MDKELKFHPTIDCFCSGTTAVTMIKQVLYRIFSFLAIFSSTNVQKLPIQSWICLIFTYIAQVLLVA